MGIYDHAEEHFAKYVQASTQQPTIRIRFRGLFIKADSGKSVWSSKAHAKAAIRPALKEAFETLFRYQTSISYICTANGRTYSYTEFNVMREDFIQDMYNNKLEFVES